MCVYRSGRKGCCKHVSFHCRLCVLLCFIQQVLGNRYGPGVSSRKRGTQPHDWKSPTSLLTLSPLKQPGVSGSSPST